MSLASARQFLAVQLAALFLMSGVLSAQAPGTGAITGSVHDPSGLVVVNAVVSAVNESTDVTRTATTNSTGVFSMPLLVPGTYSVTVKDPGFAENTLHSVGVVVGETSSVEFKLTIKAVSVALDVSGDTEIVQSQSSTLGRAVLQEGVHSLPLSSRNYTQILSLSPGVVVALPNATALGRGSQNVSANGGKTTANNVQFNGVDANNLAQNSVENATEEVGVAIPAPDTIEELSISALAVGASFLLAHVHLFGDAGLYGAQAAQAPIPEHAPISPAARAILIAKCADCHSTQTHAPIYSRFAPISWLMERDILEGRKYMNLSQWDSYSADQQQTFAAKIVQETKSHDMPLPQYRMIHWDTRITDADVRVFSQWEHGSSTPADSAMQATADGDPVRGAALFDKRCTGCHSLTTNREGPILQGVYGRTTGSVPAFPYSAALKNAHIAWTDQSLDKWLTDPDAFLPGNNMDFLVARPQERKDLIAYFKQSAGRSASHHHRAPEDSASQP